MRRMLAVALSFLTLLAPLSIPARAVHSEWAEAEINAARSDGLLYWIGEDEDMGEAATRIDLAAQLVVVYEKTTDAPIELECNIKDTADTNAVKVCSLGIMNVDDGVFNPGAQVTREEAFYCFHLLILKLFPAAAAIRPEYLFNDSSSFQTSEGYAAACNLYFWRILAGLQLQGATKPPEEAYERNMLPSDIMPKEQLAVLAERVHEKLPLLAQASPISPAWGYYQSLLPYDFIDKFLLDNWFLLNYAKNLAIGGSVQIYASYSKDDISSYVSEDFRGSDAHLELLWIIINMNLMSIVVIPKEQVNNNDLVEFTVGASSSYLNYLMYTSDTYESRYISGRISSVCPFPDYVPPDYIGFWYISGMLLGE